MRARALAWGLEVRTLGEKYKIERLIAAEKAANLQAIRFEAPEEGPAKVSPEPGGNA
ncbi:hypothetical protein [Streptomyces mirabilis]|uniref:Uncharacterized protein n=1 Tax=Streptomyces mirabilis TaxID=68239 RepID=A0ABU3V518_9ACTN|nr:hypothetical protein [Streptomyces mirabilis]MCX5355625.1 hypothetical protein [Streptomyces mirabilis]MDU9001271.1 hypothetical protein [Streptomyces mirabilis]